MRQPHRCRLLKGGLAGRRNLLKNLSRSGTQGRGLVGLQHLHAVQPAPGSGFSNISHHGIPRPPILAQAASISNPDRSRFAVTRLGGGPHVSKARRRATEFNTETTERTWPRISPIFVCIRGIRGKRISVIKIASFLFFGKILRDKNSHEIEEIFSVFSVCLFPWHFP